MIRFRIISNLLLISGVLFMLAACKTETSKSLPTPSSTSPSQSSSSSPSSSSKSSQSASKSSSQAQQTDSQAQQTDSQAQQAANQAQQAASQAQQAANQAQQAASQAQQAANQAQQAASPDRPSSSQAQQAANQAQQAANQAQQAASQAQQAASQAQQAASQGQQARSPGQQLSSQAQQAANQAQQAASPDRPSSSQAQQAANQAQQAASQAQQAASLAQQAARQAQQAAAATQSPSTAPSPATGVQAGESPGRSSGQKTDDEILAEALKAFDKNMQASGIEGESQGGPGTPAQDHPAGDRSQSMQTSTTGNQHGASTSTAQAGAGPETGDAAGSLSTAVTAATSPPAPAGGTDKGTGSRNTGQTVYGTTGIFPPSSEQQGNGAGGDSASKKGQNVYGAAGITGHPGDRNLQTGDSDISGQQVVIVGGGNDKQGSTEEPGFGGGTGTGTPGAMTDAERILVLSGQLDKSLSQFDSAILSEREAVRQEENEQGSQSGYGEAGGDMDEGAGSETSPQQTAMLHGTGGTSASGGGHLPNAPGTNRKGIFKHSPTQTEIPPDIPDGSDDDVVAGQLREAAMKETDPVLRKKLWDEYRKYKKGVVSKR
ncbi:MAG: hypothetical protein ACE5GZ_08215 [Gammaproteobacteria bacterium]